MSYYLWESFFCILDTDPLSYLYCEYLILFSELLLYSLSLSWGIGLNTIQFVIFSLMVSAFWLLLKNIFTYCSIAKMMICIFFYNKLYCFTFYI